MNKIHFKFNTVLVVDMHSVHNNLPTFQLSEFRILMLLILNSDKQQ
jgi:hypothetical protein